MVGTMGDVSLADALVNRIPGFDRDAAYAAIRKDAFEPPVDDGRRLGRECLEVRPGSRGWGAARRRWRVPVRHVPHVFARFLLARCVHAAGLAPPSAARHPFSFTCSWATCLGSAGSRSRAPSTTTRWALLHVRNYCRRV